MYYSFNNTGIIRFDTKTGKKKKIRDIKIGKSQGRWFESLSLKGNYFYAAWNKQVGGSRKNGSADYIYRISKDGKKVKKLAKGRMPVIVGNYIYYMKTVYNKQTGYDENANVIMRMKLDGSAKKTVKKLSKGAEVSGLYRCGNQLVYGFEVNYQNYRYYNLNGKALASDTFVWTGNICVDQAKCYTKGGYDYYTDSESRDVLYRKNKKTGKVSKILKLNPKGQFSEKVVSYYVSGDHIIVETFYTHMAFAIDVTKVYYIKTDGKAKKKLGEYNNFLD